MAKTKRRLVIALASIVVLSIAAWTFSRWRSEPRCDPEPLEILGRELAEQPVEDRMMRRAEVYAAVERACPRVPKDYFLLIAGADSEPARTGIEPPRKPTMRLGRALTIDCGPEGQAAADAQPEAWRGCADTLGYPSTLALDRHVLRSQKFFEDEGVSREAARTLVWIAAHGWSVVPTPLVRTWTAVEPESEALIDGQGYDESALYPDGFAIAGRLPISTFTEHRGLGRERTSPRQLLRALSIAHGPAFPQWVWLPISIDGFFGARPPCVDVDGQVTCEDSVQTAVELGPGRLWLARGDRRVELAWADHDELVAALRDDERLASVRAQPAWIAVTDPEAVEWRSFVALVDFFAPATCVPSSASELDPACAEPFVRLFLGETLVYAAPGG